MFLHIKRCTWIALSYWLKSWRYLTLREKCPNTEFFLVRIFPRSGWIWRDTEFSVFSSNTGKYGPEKNSVFEQFSHSVTIKD